MKSNIILIGMPGSGKSTLGILLAKALSKTFVDGDALIQSQTGRTLQQIIDAEGNDAFLELEGNVLASFEGENSVLATGGSAVYSDHAMKALEQNGLIVYLQVSCDEVIRRIPNLATRGVVLKHGCGLDAAYAERVPLYKRYAELTVDCDHESVEESVQNLCSAIQKITK